MEQFLLGIMAGMPLGGLITGFLFRWLGNTANDDKGCVKTDSSDGWTI